MGSPYSLIEQNHGISLELCLGNMSYCWEISVCLNGSEKAVSGRSWVLWGFTPWRFYPMKGGLLAVTITVKANPVLSEIQTFWPFQDMKTFYSFHPFPITTILLCTLFLSESLCNKNYLWKFCIQCELHVELIGYRKTKTLRSKTFCNKKLSVERWSPIYVLHVERIGYHKESLIAPSTDVTHRRQIWGRK